MYKYILKHKNYFLQLCILVFFVLVSFLANRFPTNSFVAGGDFYQLFEPAKHFDRYAYAWLNQTGQGSFNTLFVTYPFYALTAFLQHLGMSSGAMASFYMFFVLYSSYWSFNYSIKKLFPQIHGSLRVGGGLLYAFNNFTLTIFTYPWGFTHHFFAYIFVPPLIALFSNLLKDKSFKTLVEFNIVLLLSLISLNNLAFLAAVVLLQLLVLLLSLIFKVVKPDKELLVQLLKIGASYFVSNGLVILIWFLALGDSLGGVSTSKSLGGSLKGWIIATSSNFTNTFSLALDSSRIPISSSTIVSAVSILYIIFLVCLAIKAFSKPNFKEGDSGQNKILIFLILFLVLVFLSVRAYSIFEIPNLIIYQLPFFAFFRSPEKIFMLIPFVYLSAMTGLILFVKLRRVYEYIILGVLLLIPSAFYTDQAVKELTGRDASHYGYVTTIPDEYKKAAETVNHSQLDSAVLSLPYSVVNSINWSNYPAWGFVGQDPLHLIFEKRFISANTYDHPLIEDRPTFKYDQDSIASSQFLLDLQKFGAEFVIVHKDIDPKWLKDSREMTLIAQELVGKGILTKIDDNVYFDLYQLDSKYVRPLITTTKTNVTYQKVNNSRYEIHLQALKGSDTLRFDQSFNRYWKLYFASASQLDCDAQAVYPSFDSISCKSINTYVLGDELSFLSSKKTLSATHELADGYANSWKFSAEEIKKDYPGSYTENPDGNIDVTLTLYFEPQTYLYLFFGVSALLLVGDVIILVAIIRRERKKNALKV